MNLTFVGVTFRSIISHHRFWMNSLFMTVCFVISMSSFNAQATDIDSLLSRVTQLEARVNQLEQKVLALQYSQSRSTQVIEYQPRASGQVWGCYLDDLTVGGLYSTGMTQAEAKGRILQKCKQQGGTCFESRVTCNQSN